MAAPNPPAPQKYYFVKTDGTFQQNVTWIKLQDSPITGLCEVSLPYISGNDVEDFVKKVPADKKKWWRMYDFSRTVGATLRLMMLKGTGLLEYHDPALKATARGRNEFYMKPQTSGTSINDLGRLAGNTYEAQWVSAYFDMLFPHFFLENQLTGIVPGEPRSLPTNELIVLDIHHHVFWQMEVSLKVEKLEAPPNFVRFEAKPTFTVKLRKYRPPPPIPAPRYPLGPAPGPDDVVKKMDDLNI